MRRRIRSCQTGDHEETSMKAAARQQLDPTIRSNDTREFQNYLRAKIVGQEEGVQALVAYMKEFEKSHS